MSLVSLFGVKSPSPAGALSNQQNRGWHHSFSLKEGALTFAVAMAHVINIYDVHVMKDGKQLTVQKVRHVW